MTAAAASNKAFEAYLDHRRACPQCMQTTYLCSTGGRLLEAVRIALGPCQSCGETVHRGHEQYVTVRERAATRTELVHRAPCKGPPAE